MRKIYVVGIGCNGNSDLTMRAVQILEKVECIYCSKNIGSKLQLFSDKMVCSEHTLSMQRCSQAVDKALLDCEVAILCNGDAGVYGIAEQVISLVNQRDEGIPIEIVPGITAAISGASVLGAPLMQDFAVISLSSNLYDKNATMQRIFAAASTDFVIVLYSVCNPTKDNLQEALEIIEKQRGNFTVIGVVTDVGSEEEEIFVTRLCDFEIEKVRQKSTLFIGKSSTKIMRNGMMVTPLIEGAKL